MQLVLSKWDKVYRKFFCFHLCLNNSIFEIEKWHFFPYQFIWPYTIFKSQFRKTEFADKWYDMLGKTKLVFEVW